MNIDSQTISLMRELVEVQEARKANVERTHGARKESL
jgi:hypothetical protein